jgi:hypothetical protein
MSCIVPNRPLNRLTVPQPTGRIYFLKENLRGCHTGRDGCGCLTCWWGGLAAVAVVGVINQAAYRLIWLTSLQTNAPLLWSTTCTLYINSPAFLSSRLSPLKVCAWYTLCLSTFCHWYTMSLRWAGPTKYRTRHPLYLLHFIPIHRFNIDLWFWYTSSQRGLGEPFASNSFCRHVCVPATHWH